MARKQVERTLAPLDEAFASFKSFPDKASNLSVLTDELRRGAQKLRTKESRPFYSMRDVAGHFKVPLRTVAIAYEKLELEGLLNRIRGSRTMLAGKTRSSRIPVRGIIGIPLWFHSIFISPYARLLHRELEDRLRLCGFVADIVFFRSEEVAHVEFAERLLQHKFDYVIWHTPHARSQQTLLTLKDNGVHQIVIQQAESPTSLAMPTYTQSWEKGYREMAKQWHQTGIRDVLIVDPVFAPSRRAIKSFVSILKEGGLTPHLLELSATKLREEAMKYSPWRCGIAFLDQMTADVICNENPVLIEELLSRCRIAFCRGPIYMPYFRNREGKIDLVRFSAEEAAGRIAGDIRDNRIPAIGEVPTFEATFEPGVQIRDTIDPL